MTTDVAIESANRHANDIQTITANAASAAASSAVQAAMQIHREQLEQLRNEALNKGETLSGIPCTCRLHVVSWLAFVCRHFHGP